MFYIERREKKHCVLFHSFSPSWPYQQFERSCQDETVILKYFSSSSGIVRLKWGEENRASCVAETCGWFARQQCSIFFYIIFLNTEQEWVCYDSPWWFICSFSTANIPIALHSWCCLCFFTRHSYATQTVPSCGNRQIQHNTSLANIPAIPQPVSISEMLLTPTLDSHHTRYPGQMFQIITSF